MLSEAGVFPILINLHYFPDAVRQYLKTSGFANKVTTVYEEQLLGTAGTILQNRSFFGAEPFMLVHADNLSQFNVTAYIRSHWNRPVGCEITMMTFHTANPESCGIVELDDRGVVQNFYEKVPHPPGDLANGAVYILEPTIFEYLKSLGKKKIDFSTEVLPYYMGRIFTFHNNCYHRDIGTIENYESANKEFSQS